MKRIKKKFPGVVRRSSGFCACFRVNNKTVMGHPRKTIEEAYADYREMTIERNKKYITPVDFIEGEEWKEIDGYDGRYWVSNLGRVKNTNFMGMGLESLMTPHPNKDGYYMVHLRPKYLKTSILVWVAFNGDYDRKKKQVNHMDLDKSNNRLDNLELVYVRENQCHSQQRIHGKTMMGCYWDKKKKRWIALCSVDGKQRYLGAYLTQEEAHERYLQEVALIGETNKYSYAS